MNENNNAVQGKMDPVEMRAAEIAKRDRRDSVTDEDRQRAFHELQEMSPPATKSGT
ncbi:MAG: hypothetical protein JWO94_344 [Verrucomicrobiaceae bacterium]|nr:hypothetical protein [Verrucomicrobiaceae bacterium]